MTWSQVLRRSKDGKNFLTIVSDENKTECISSFNQSAKTFQSIMKLY